MKSNSASFAKSIHSLNMKLTQAKYKMQGESNVANRSHLTNTKYGQHKMNAKLFPLLFKK